MAEQSATLRTSASFYVWGIILVLLGLFILFFPTIALGVLAIALGILIIIRSLSLISGGSGTGENRSQRSALVALGILGIIFGLLVVISPVFTVIA